jgi:hypothetical protein
LSSASGSAIKRINGWREGPPVTVSWQSLDLLAGPSPSRQKSASNEKRILLCGAGRSLLNQDIGRFKTTIRMGVRPVFTATPLRDAASGGQGWRCVPDGQRACTVSLEFARPITFDVVKLQTSQVPHLLYTQVFIDDRLSRDFHDHFLSSGGDGQPVIVFYHRQRGQSLRLKIPAPYATDSTVTAVQFYQREWGLALKHPLRSFHPQPAYRL